MGEANIQISDIIGANNANFELAKARINNAKTYRDLSTICIVPAISAIPPKIVQAWRSLLTPMNQKFIMIMMENMEVGEAYTQAIDMILANPQLNTWKYLLTLETDNAPQPDALLKLYEDIDEYDAVGALYWTKGDMGQPMCYGDTRNPVVNFIPFVPEALGVATRCYGLGMGFTLFKLDMFKDPRLPKPIFETRQKFTNGIGVESYTQDLKAFETLGKLGYKFACSTKALCGHYDYQIDRMF